MIIEAFFYSLIKANDAIVELNNYGFDKVYLDINDRLIKDINTITNFPGAYKNTSLSDLILYSGDYGASIEKAPLFAADPNVSGMAGFNEIINLSYKIKIEADSNRINDVKNIVIKLGGTFIS